MRCPRCSNTDEAYFYLGSKGYYCRKCIKFKRVLIDEILSKQEYDINPISAEYELKYTLTKAQKDISNKCKMKIRSMDILLYCVCGAGKTELVMESIADFLKEGKKVCYAIARREVVLDLYERFKSIYHNAKVIRLCAGYTDEIYGDLIICTTHQLYRYHHSFDLLILDEVDAFPFKGNEVLENIAINSLNDSGHIIYSSATIDENVKEFIDKRPHEILSLYKRPHHKPLIEPKIIYLPKILIYLNIYRYLKRTNKQCIIFTETKSRCMHLYNIFKRIFKITYVYSDLEDRNKNIKAFKDKEFDFIIATTVLERGITIHDINVIILNIEGNIFDKSSIIQMVGRVGRSMKNPYGEALIYTTFKDNNLLQARKEICYANKMPILR